MLLFIFMFLLLMKLELAYCFPSVYPQGTTIYTPGKAYEGYTIYVARQGSGLSKVLMIDMNGTIVHSWERADMECGHTEPLPNKNILCTFNSGAGLVELDWGSNVVWRYDRDSSIGVLHHDFERLENGNTLILTHQLRDVPEISPKTILDDSIYEIDPQGQIVWQWHTYEHFNEFGFSAKAKTLIAQSGSDWAHTNSIQSLPDNLLNDQRFKKGNILVSQRQTNIMYIIDKNTGKIVWKVGPDNNLTIGQHNVEMISQDLPGAGRILVFDNGFFAGYPLQYRLYSRVVEINPLLKHIVWNYNATTSGKPQMTFFSTFLGSAQRLPNGNTLIDEGMYGRFFEITTEGEIVWEYINPFFVGSPESNMVYRCYRVNLDWIP